MLTTSCRILTSIPPSFIKLLGLYVHKYLCQIWNIFYYIFFPFFRWKEIIRSDQKLSGDLKLISCTWKRGLTKLSSSEANAILSDWKKLHTIRISRDLKNNTEINFKNHPNLKRIIVTNHQRRYKL